MSSPPGSLILQPGGGLAPQDLRTYIEQARKQNVSIWDVLVDEKGLAEDVIADTFAAWLRLPRLRLASVTIDPEATKTISEDLARKYICVALKVEGKSLTLAMSNPADFAAQQDLQFATGLSMRVVVATRTEILDAIDQYYKPEDQLRDFLANVAEANDLSIMPEEKEAELDDIDSRNAAELPPVVKMCNLIIQDAIKSGASDIHVEPTLNSVTVRMRVDGVLREYMQVPKWLHTAVVSRLKILAKLDIAERRVPQDGRIKVQMAGKPVDLRMSTLPTQFGEKTVMRVLGSSEIPPLEKMGFSEVQWVGLMNGLHQPQGLILVTGPTGSGKSTTLYSMLGHVKSPEVNIITVEDPIEYQLAGINQVQVNVKAGLTFAAALRSILRQDPDIVLLGEIRDLETAEIAFHAAMTGHLVLSTLHTNSSLATVARLLDLGVDPFLISSSINLILAQRLARRICTKCKEPHRPPAELLARLNLQTTDMVFYHGAGCSACGQSGYSGRLGLYEVLRMTPLLKELVNRKAPEAEMAKVAGLAGTRFLLEDAMEKVRKGSTSLEEILRVIQLQETEIIRCPKCSSFINLDFATCPYCLFALKHVCPSCSQELKLEWKTCPYCNTPTSFSPELLQVSAKTLPPGVPETAPEPAALPPPPPALLPGREPAVPPAAETPAPPPAPASVPAAAIPEGKKPRILVVDDDESIRKIVQKALMQLPIPVDVGTAGDGVEALDMIQQDPPDAVILDMMMPRMDGLTVCQKLREYLRTAFVPVMMLTANADEANRTQAYLVGTDDYMSKPFSVQELTARVMRLLRRTYGL